MGTVDVLAVREQTAGPSAGSGTAEWVPSVAAKDAKLLLELWSEEL